MQKQPAGADGMYDSGDGFEDVSSSDGDLSSDGENVEMQ